MVQATTQQFATRPYTHDDEEQVLALLAQTLPRWAQAGGERPALWRWKHLLNPFGPSQVQVALDNTGTVIGTLALMPWQLRHAGRVLRAARAVDLATHPNFRRKGVATLLSEEAVEAIKADRPSIVFHTPNRASIGIALKRSPLFVGVISPSIQLRHVARLLVRRAFRLRLAAGQNLVGDILAHALPIRSWLERDGEVQQLLGTDFPRQFRTERTLGYLRWRYADRPLEPYYALNIDDQGELLGSVIFRVSSGATTNGIVIQDLLMRNREPHVPAAFRRGLDSLRHADFFAGCVSHDPLERAVLGHLALIAVPRMSYRLAVRAVDPELAEAAHQISAWSLAMGDLDGF